MHQVAPAGWTPKRVGETLTEALRWAAVSAGQVGPRGFSRSSALSSYKATLDDHLAEGWGLPELAEEEPEKQIRPAYSFTQIRLFQQAIHWQFRYLYPDHPVSARILKAWLVYSITRNGRAFEAAVKEAGISRQHAYRIRDKALSIICAGLWRDGAQPPERITLSD